MTQHVVIVDDNDLSLKLLGSIASEIHDVVVHPFQSPNEALAWFEGEDVDCFIFDQHMPAPDGVEMIQRVRAMRRFALVPIVIVTGEHDRDVRYRAFDAGANDFVLKPLDYRELISRLKTLLALQAAQKQLAMQIGSLESRNLELAALNGELDSFTYSVSHDLRGPSAPSSVMHVLLAKTTPPRSTRRATAFSPSFKTRPPGWERSSMICSRSRDSGASR